MDGVDKTLVVLPDGKILCGGEMNSGGNYYGAFVASFDADGVPDSTFGNSSTPSLGAGIIYPSAVSSNGPGRSILAWRLGNGAKREGFAPKIQVMV